MRLGPFEINEPVPDLKEPHALAMLRPWIDVGSVGTLVLSHLERYMGGRELGKLARPGTFFDFTRYRPTISVREGQREVVVPNSFINYAKRENSHDFLFLHLLEPHMFGEDYADAVIEILKRFGVKRYILLGAMYDAVPHTRPLLVTGSNSGQGKPLGEHLQSSTYQGPTTINYLVTQQAPEMGIEVSSLIAHLPQYVQLEEDYTGAGRVLEILQQAYSLPANLIDQERAQVQYEEITRAVAGNARLLPVIKELEATYDAKTALEQAQRQKGPPLARAVEDFLRELDEGFKGESKG